MSTNPEIPQNDIDTVLNKLENGENASIFEERLACLRDAPREYTKNYCKEFNKFFYKKLANLWIDSKKLFDTIPDCIWNIPEEKRVA